MADFNVSAAQIGAYEIGLSPNVVRTVAFADDVPQIEVATISADRPVYFTVNGQAASVAGQQCYCLLPGANAIQVDVPTAGASLVSLITAGTSVVNVSRT